MIVEGNTPKEIFVQENDESIQNSICQGESVSGMVKYIREDLVPNEKEMLEFAKSMTYHLDDRLCPFSREELRAYAFLKGMDFAKRNQEKQVVEKPVILKDNSCSTMTVSEFCKRFSHNNEVYIENRNNYFMRYRYRKDNGYKDAHFLMDWELKYTTISDYQLIRISNVMYEGVQQAITFVVDTEEENFEFVPEKVTYDNAPLWLYEKVHGVSLEKCEVNGCN
ncbi:MAG: hypothetical protein J6X18_13370 [Bacteroidales bacterium]|nr:hypothetical protein [Bacteroidales bacterium]